MSSAAGSSRDPAATVPAHWVAETLYAGWAQSFRVLGEVVCERSNYQEIRILDTSSHGRVMLLDGIVQITEADEFVYQEMIAHVPLIQHGAAKAVLIIGAGDGGVLRRVLLHQGVQQVTMVEIDEAVIRLAKRYLPSIGGDAWADARANVVIGDGIAYVAEAAAASVDVIIVDSTDPDGPGQVLFTGEFYRDCARILTTGGLLVNQCGVPFMQPAELTASTALRRSVFTSVTAYLTNVPTYVGGPMALGIASNEPIAPLSLPTIVSRALEAGIESSSRYWSPSVHLAAFALPPFIERLLVDQS